MYSPVHHLSLSASMPTERPRLTVTITPKIDRALGDFAKLSGKSKGSIVLEALEAMVPMMEKTAVLMQAVNRQSPAALASLKGRVNDLETLLTGVAKVAGSGMDLFMQPDAPVSERSERSGASGKSGKASPPPLSNRGVRKSGERTKVVPIRGGRPRG
jgi:hypothetical protein